MSVTIKYLCGVDYQREWKIGLADFYNTVLELQIAKRCWEECGIVRIMLGDAGEELSHKWVVEQNMKFTNDPEQTEESDPQNQT